MINKLSERYSNDSVEDYYKYVIKCPTYRTILNFGKGDVHKDEDEFCIHYEYIICPECNEHIRLNDDDYFGF